MQEQVHLEQSPDRPTMRRFLACQNSILEKGASEHSWFLGVQKVTMRSEYTVQSGPKSALI